MRIAFTPDWFANFDVAINIFSFIILVLFFIFSIRSYLLSKNKKSLYLGIGFLSIALAELATIFTKIVLFYDISFTQQVGQMVVTYHVVKSVDIFYKIGFFFHKLLTLTGLYIIYRFPLKRLSQNDFFLSIFFLILSALAGEMIYFVFHIATIALLILIIKNFNKIYTKNKLHNTRILIIAFSMLLVSHIFFIFSTMRLVYITGQILQLISYITLLVLIMNIIYNAKTKSK
jgi:hypothetical protein